MIRPGFRAIVLLLGLLAAGVASAADIDEMQASTVRVICKPTKGLGTGSGFVVGDARSTVVITNMHVIQCADTLPEPVFILLGPNEMVPAQVLWKDAVKDLAILRPARPLQRPSARIADTSQLKVGTPIIVIGFPGAADDVVDTDQVTSPSVTRGNVSRLVTSGSGGIRQIQHSAPTNPGNSGGPIFSDDGEVIGINSRKALTQVATPNSKGELSLERVPVGEGIAVALDIAEVLPHLASQGVVIEQGGTFNSTLLLVGAGALTVGAAILFLALPAGRALLFGRRVQASAPASRGSSPMTVNAAPCRAKVRVTAGALAGRDFLVGDGLVLGRDPAAADLVFPSDSDRVSRRHCEIRFEGATDRFVVTDLGSRNGTFIQMKGRQTPLVANQPQSLSSGTVLLIGGGGDRVVLEVG